MTKQQLKIFATESIIYQEHKRNYFVKNVTLRRLKMTFWITIFLFLSIGLNASSGASQVQYLLENASTKLMITDNRIVSMYDKIRKIEHISTQTEPIPGLFNIQLVKGILPASVIDATQMGLKVVSKKQDELEFEFSHKEATSKVKVKLASSVAEIDWSISVFSTDPEFMVGTVSFPVLMTPILADGIEKTCLLPFYEGRLHPITEPIVAYKPKVYPATLFAQMNACIGTKGGFLLWTADKIPNVKEFKYSLADGNATFSVIHRMPYEAGEWKCSYETRISFCNPSWFEAAEIYRNWAAQQYWCATKFKDRKDMPAFLHQPHFHSSVQLSKEPDLKSIPENLALLSKQIDAPVIVRGTYWEKHGGWIGVDYFPPSIGDDGLRSFTKELKDKGIPVIYEIAGYKWMSGQEKSVVLNQINKATPELRAKLEQYFVENKGASVCEMGVDGKLNPSTTICRGSAYGQKLMPDLAKKLFDLGVTAFDCDSDPGTTPDGVSGCFNPDHGHPVPCGPWSTESTRNSFREITAEASRRGIKDFFFIKEHCTEQLNMDVHAYLSRLSLSYAQPYTVPLTQFLYHEYLPVMLYNSKNEELNDIIIYGQVPGGSPLQANIPVTVDYYAAMKVFAKDYLLYGKMLKPIIEGIPENKVLFDDEKSGKKIEIIVPVVRQSAWEDESGNTGLFAINTQKEQITVQVPVPGKGDQIATFFIGDKELRKQTVKAGEKIEWTITPERLEAIIFKSIKKRNKQ